MTPNPSAAGGSAASGPNADRVSGVAGAAKAAGAARARRPLHSLHGRAGATGATGATGAFGGRADAGGQTGSRTGGGGLGRGGKDIRVSPAALPRAAIRLSAGKLPQIVAQWRLQPKAGAPRSTDGFRVIGGDAAIWLAHLSTQPVALQALAQVLPLADGALIRFPAGLALPVRTSPRLRPYHRLLVDGTRELWLPCDADLLPALELEQLTLALFTEENLCLIAEPGQAQIGGAESELPAGSRATSEEPGASSVNPVRWLAESADQALRPAQLLHLATSGAAGAAGAPANRGDLNRPPPLLTHPTLAIRRVLQHTAEELLERGREDIATALDQVPDETRGWLAKLLDQLILGDRADPNDPRRSAAGITGHAGGPNPALEKSARGFGDRLLQIMKAGGTPPPTAPTAADGNDSGGSDPHGKHWLRAGLNSLMHLFNRKPAAPGEATAEGSGSNAPMDAEAMRNFSLRQKLLEWWLERSPRAQNEFYGEQRNAIVQLLHEFEKGSVQEALRHALPLAPSHNPKSVHPVGLYDSARLPENDLNGPLNIDRSRRPTVVWVGGSELMEDLRKNYTQAALQLIREGRHQKAAYIYAMLLGDFWQAAHVLAQGGLHREAAQVYLEQLGDFRWAATEFEAAGDLERAAELYLKLEDYDRAARVFENAGLMEDAHRVYRQQADRLFEQKNYLAAGHVHAYKLQDVAGAVAIFETGLRQSTGSIASELAVAALRCQLEQGRYEDAGVLEARVNQWWIDDLTNLTSVQGLMHFTGELAILGKDLKPEGAAGALKRAWSEHVLKSASRLAKIHQEAGRPGYMSRALDPLHRMFFDDPACFSDAQRAQAMRQKLRTPLRRAGDAVREMPVRDFARLAGHMQVTCAAISSETGIIVCGDFEGAVWLYDPATQKLLQRSGIGAPAVAVSIEAGGYYVAVLDAQKHMRIFQTGAGLTELTTVSAFSVAGAVCMAPQIVRDRIFVGTRFGSIVSYRLVDGLSTGEPFILHDGGLAHLCMLSEPNRLLAVTSTGRFTLLSYNDNRLEPLDGWQDLPEIAGEEPQHRMVAAVAGASATGDLILQVSGLAGRLLRYNPDSPYEPAYLDAPSRGSVSAFGCLNDGTLVVSLRQALYRFSLRNDEPHELLPIELTGIEPRWILPHPQTDRFWIVDTAGNARLVGLPKSAGAGGAKGGRKGREK